MQLKIYSDTPPSGRCLLLAKALSECCVLSPRESVAVAESIFASRHDAEHPKLVRLKEGVQVTDVTRICREFGITAELTE